MAIDKLRSIKSDPKVLEALEAAQKMQMTIDDIVEQRVSYVYGSLGKDSNITKEQVRRAVQEKLMIPTAA